MAKKKKKRRHRRKNDPDPRKHWDPQVFRAAMAANNMSAPRLREEMALRLGVVLSDPMMPTLNNIYDWRRPHHMNNLHGPQGEYRNELIRAISKVLGVTQAALRGE